MAGYPAKCPSCGEANPSGLNYCARCGAVFKRSDGPVASGRKKEPGQASREQKLKLKREKKKKELIELFRRGKITRDQFAGGMRKLGYSTDIEKALEFKKYIREQIKAFEKMDVSGAEEGGYHFDPNESKAELPRDRYGNLITDFSVSPRPAKEQSVSVPYHSHYAEVVGARTTRSDAPSSSGSGPAFGESREKSAGRTPDREIPKAKLRTDRTVIPAPRSRHRSGDLDWDEDEEEFEIDLGEEFEGESGWWDDDEWELDWSDEDEEEWESWEEEEDDDEWVWEEEDELPDGVTVEFEDDDEWEPVVRRKRRN